MIARASPRWILGVATSSLDPQSLAADQLVVTLCLTVFQCMAPSGIQAVSVRRDFVECMGGVTRLTAAVGALDTATSEFDKSRE